MEVFPELRLLADALKANFSDERPALRPHDDVDWKRFLQLAQFHRVEGLAARGLSESDFVPADIRSALSSAAAAIAAQNLRAATECVRLQQSFAEAGIPILFVKGLALGARAYESAWTKAAVDIDLLIHSSDLDRAAALLGRVGYDLSSPADPRRLGHTHRLRKESAWSHRGAKLQVDLHTRLADSPRLIRDIGMRSPVEQVEIMPATVLPTLRDDHLLAYLAVHGASSAWFRLKWIVDFAALLHRTELPVRESFERSRQLGAGRAIDQALLVADALFGVLERDPSLRSALQKSGANRRLCAAALHYLLKPAPDEPTSRATGTLPIHVSQFLLSPGLTFKLSELGRQARAALFA